MYPTISESFMQEYPKDLGGDRSHTHSDRPQDLPPLICIMQFLLSIFHTNLNPFGPRIDYYKNICNIVQKVWFWKWIAIYNLGSAYSMTLENPEGQWQVLGLICLKILTAQRRCRCVHRTVYAQKSRQTSRLDNRKVIHISNV